MPGMKLRQVRHETKMPFAGGNSSFILIKMDQEEQNSQWNALMVNRKFLLAKSELQIPISESKSKLVPHL